MVAFCFLTLNKVKLLILARDVFVSLFFLRLFELQEISHEDMEQISRFIILLYDQSSPTTSVNECRRVLFTQKKRSIKGIPPTEDSLVQHMKRAMLQSQQVICVYKVYSTCFSRTSSVIVLGEFCFPVVSSSVRINC